MPFELSQKFLKKVPLIARLFQDTSIDEKSILSHQQLVEVDFMRQFVTRAIDDNLADHALLVVDNSGSTCETDGLVIKSVDEKTGKCLAKTTTRLNEICDKARYFLVLYHIMGIDCTIRPLNRTAFEIKDDNKKTETYTLEHESMNLKRHGLAACLDYIDVIEREFAWTDCPTPITKHIEAFTEITNDSRPKIINILCDGLPTSGKNNMGNQDVKKAINVLALKLKKKLSIIVNLCVEDDDIVDDWNKIVDAVKGVSSDVKDDFIGESIEVHQQQNGPLPYIVYLVASAGLLPNVKKYTNYKSLDEKSINPIDLLDEQTLDRHLYLFYCQLITGEKEFGLRHLPDIMAKIPTLLLPEYDQKTQKCPYRTLGETMIERPTGPKYKQEEREYQLRSQPLINPKRLLNAIYNTKAFTYNPVKAIGRRISVGLKNTKLTSPPEITKIESGFSLELLEEALQPKASTLKMSPEFKDDGAFVASAPEETPGSPAAGTRNTPGHRL